MDNNNNNEEEEPLLEIDLIRALSTPGRPAAAAATKTTTTTTTTTTGQSLSQEYSSGTHSSGNISSKWDAVVFSNFHGLRPQDLVTGDIFFSSRLRRDFEEAEVALEARRVVVVNLVGQRPPQASSPSLKGILSSNISLLISSSSPPPPPPPPSPAALCLFLSLWILTERDTWM